MNKVKLKTNWIGWSLLFLVSIIPWFWFLFVRLYVVGRTIPSLGISEHSIGQSFVLVTIAFAPLLVLFAFVCKQALGFKVFFYDSKKITLQGRETYSFCLGELDHIRFYFFFSTIIFKLKDGKSVSVCSLSASDLAKSSYDGIRFIGKRSKFNVFWLVNLILILAAVYAFLDFGKRHYFTLIIKNESLALERFSKIFPFSDFSYRRISLAGSKSTISALGWSSYIDSYDVPNILVRFGADINKGDLDTGDTPLFISIKNNNMKTAAQLLIDGASPLVKNKKAESVCSMLWADQKKFEKDYKIIYPLVYARCLEGKK